MDIRNIIDNDIVNNKTDKEIFFEWLIGNEVDNKTYELFLDKMQECLELKDGDLSKFYYYEEYNKIKKNYNKYKSIVLPKEMKIFLEQMKFIHSINNFNNKLKEFGYSEILPIDRNIEDEFVNAIYFLYDKYIENDDILSRYLDGLDKIDKNVLLSINNKFEDQSFFVFINGDYLFDMNIMIKNINFSKYVNLSSGINESLYIFYLLLEKEFKKNKVVDSRKFRKYIIGNDGIGYPFAEKLEKFGIYTSFYEKRNSFNDLFFCLFSKNKELLNKEASLLKQYFNDYLGISEKKMIPIFNELNEELQKLKMENIKQNIKQKAFENICLKHPEWKHINFKYYYYHSDLYIIMDSLFCKLLYHNGKNYYYKIDYSFLDKYNNEFDIENTEKKGSIDIPLTKAYKRKKSVYGNALAGGLIAGSTGATVAALKTISDNSNIDRYNNSPTEIITSNYKTIEHELRFSPGDYKDNFYISFNEQDEFSDIMNFYCHLKSSRLSLKEYKEKESEFNKNINSYLENDYIELTSKKNDLINKLSKMKFSIFGNSANEKNKIKEDIKNIELQLEYIIIYLNK